MTSLIEIVETATRSFGFEFYTGDDATIRTYPAAWFPPPSLLASTGRTEGENTFRTTLHLMTLDPADALQILETRALAIVASVAASPLVCSVTSIETSASTHSLTVHGATTLSLIFDITLWFYN